MPGQADGRSLPHRRRTWPRTCGPGSRGERPPRRCGSGEAVAADAAGRHPDRPQGAAGLRRRRRRLLPGAAARPARPGRPARVASGSGRRRIEDDATATRRSASACSTGPRAAASRRWSRRPAAPARRARPARLRRGDARTRPRPGSCAGCGSAAPDCRASSAWPRSLACAPAGRRRAGQKVAARARPVRAVAPRHGGATDDRAGPRPCGSATAGTLQCLVLVRDDFWMAVTRFMRDLEIPLVEGQNFAAGRPLRPRPRPEGAGGVRPGLRQAARRDPRACPPTRGSSSTRPSPA